MKKTNVRITLAVLSILAMVSCKKPDKKEESTPAENFRKVYILNEGNFGSSNASVSMYYPDQKVVYNDLFTAANGRAIGDVLQSMAVANDKTYFVLNNSNRIEVAGTYPLTSLAVINGLSLPRYILVVNNSKAYVSEYIDFSGGSGRLSIIDLNTNTITGSIIVGVQPENMMLYNGKVYVCNSGDNKISIINTQTDAVESTITISDGPNSIQKDINGKLWVLCGGKLSYDSNPPDFIDEANSTAGALVKIDPSNNIVETTLNFPSINGSPSRLCINKDKNKLYYTYSSKVYAHEITATSLSSSALINRNFYALNIDPISDYIYTGTYGFTSNQKVIRYTPQAQAIDSFTVGVGTNGFVFP